MPTHLRQPGPPRATRRGFSLAEMLIALAILAFGLLVVGAALPLGLRFTRESMDMINGEAAADQALAQISHSTRLSKWRSADGQYTLDNVFRLDPNSPTLTSLIRAFPLVLGNVDMTRDDSDPANALVRDDHALLLIRAWTYAVGFSEAKCAASEYDVWMPTVVPALERVYPAVTPGFTVADFASDPYEAPAYQPRDILTARERRLGWTTLARQAYHASADTALLYEITTFVTRRPGVDYGFPVQDWDWASREFYRLFQEPRAAIDSGGTGEPLKRLLPEPWLVCFTELPQYSPGSYEAETSVLRFRCTPEVGRLLPVGAIFVPALTTQTGTTAGDVQYGAVEITDPNAIIEDVSFYRNGSLVWQDTFRDLPPPPAPAPSVDPDQRQPRDPYSDPVLSAHPEIVDFNLTPNTGTGIRWSLNRRAPSGSPSPIYSRWDPAMGASPYIVEMPPTRRVQVQVTNPPPPPQQFRLITQALSWNSAEYITGPGPAYFELPQTYGDGYVAIVANMEPGTRLGFVDSGAVPTLPLNDPASGASPWVEYKSDGTLDLYEGPGETCRLIDSVDVGSGLQEIALVLKLDTGECYVTVGGTLVEEVFYLSSRRPPMFGLRAGDTDEDINDALPMFRVIDRPDDTTVIVADPGYKPWVFDGVRDDHKAWFWPVWVIPPAFNESYDSADAGRQPLFEDTSPIVTVQQRMTTLEEFDK